MSGPVASAPFELFERLVDDAGLFPPEELPMRSALSRHRADGAGGMTVLSGRFLCPGSRLGELIGCLEPDDSIELSLIGPLEREAVAAWTSEAAAERRLRLAAIEGVPASSGPDALAMLDDVAETVECYVEVPVRGDFLPLVEALAATGRRAKVRCGGLDAGLFPSAAELGSFVHLCARSAVSFKATAGLHNAVAHVDATTGFCHHGYLNLLLATCRAIDGATVDEVVAALELTDSAEAARQACGVTAELAGACRRLFVSYGSCSTSEPVQDLLALGLVSPLPVRS